VLKTAQICGRSNAGCGDPSRNFASCLAGAEGYVFQAGNYQDALRESWRRPLPRAMPEKGFLGADQRWLRAARKNRILLAGLLCQKRRNGRRVAGDSPLAIN